MSDRSWRFQVARGVVTVRDDAIGVRSTPGDYLAGQRRHWESTDRWGRVAVSVRVVGFLSSLLGVLYHFATVGVDGVGLRSAPYVLTLCLFGYALWQHHVGETTIPRDRIEAVTLDDDERELTVRHEPDPGLRSLFRSDVVETTLSLPTPEDVREAREIFRLRGVELRDAPPAEQKTVHRLRVRDGVCFCPACNTQVSPGDAACPACGYAIRVTESNGDETSDTGGEVERESEPSRG